MDKPALEKPDFEFESEGGRVSVFVDLEKEDGKVLKLNKETLQAIQAMYSYGLSKKEIAAAIGISEAVFNEIINKVPELEKAITSAHPKTKASVLQGLVKAASAGNAQAALAWLYMKGGETSPHLPKTVDPIHGEDEEDGGGISAEERLKQIVHHNNLLIKGGVLSSAQKLEIDEKSKEVLQETENNKKHILRKIGVRKDENG